MVYSLDISCKSPAFGKWTNDGKFVDMLYLTYNTQGRDLDVFTNIHINNKDIFEDIKISELFSDNWKRLLYIWKRIDFFFEDVDVVIVEGAAMSGTGRLANLANATGFYIAQILRNANDYVKIIEYAPTNIKKVFTGYGASDKVAMRDTIQRTEKYAWFEEKLKMISTQGKIDNIYNTPLEDIVDAFAIGCNYFNLNNMEIYYE